MEIELAAKRLHQMEAAQDLPADTFKLVGSGQITVRLEEPVDQIRLEASAAAEKKLASLTKPP